MLKPNPVPPRDAVPVAYKALFALAAIALVGALILALSGHLFG